MESRNGFIIVNGIELYSSVWDVILSDCYTHQNVTRISEKASKDPFLYFLTRRKVQEVLKGKLAFLKSRSVIYQTIKQLENDYENIYVIMLNSSFAQMQVPASVLEACRCKWSKVKLVMLYLDSVNTSASIYANWLRMNGIFDLVYTFDARDAQKYGLRLCTAYYSKCNVNKVSQMKQDLYFCGYVNNSREKIIRSILSHCEEKQISLSADIVGLREYCPYRDTVRLQNTLIPYKQTLNEMVEAKCILDIVKPEQAGLTLRAYEAVVYNRKLLTNNKSILDFQYYDSRYMQYFEKVEDIDWGWVKEDIKVDYHYNGEFSPLRWLEDIVKSCEGKKYNETKIS